MAEFIKINEDEIINLDSIAHISKSPRDGHANIYYISGNCSTYDSYDKLVDKIKLANTTHALGNID